MKLSLNEVLMIGAMGHADGMHDGYYQANGYKDCDVPDLWTSLVWFSDDFNGYYLKRSKDSNDFTIEWRNMKGLKNLPDKTHVITLAATTWTDTAKILVKAIKCHKEEINE